MALSKKSLLKFFVLGFAVLSAPGTGSPDVECGGFLPPNDLRVEVNSAQDKGISREEYDAVINQLEAIYAPVIAARGGQLEVERRWDDATVNASAIRLGNRYIVKMYGGLARHEAITQDGFALVLCHEIGHHLGGAPKYPNSGWGASNEGQSDYFANLKCLRQVFRAKGAEVFSRPVLADNEAAAASCARSFPDQGDREVCVRSAAAGMSVTTLFRVLRRETQLPRFDTPDPRVVAQTYNSHPGTQCRLDTYFQGSICTRPLRDELSDTDPTAGTCTRFSGHEAGLRPLCWYKPPVGLSAGFLDVASARGPLFKEGPAVSSLKAADEKGF